MEALEVAAEQAAIETLQANDRGSYTLPASGLYPHQWLWDSCFIAVGLRHLDVARAQVEITSLLRGQWSNGMLPHMIFAHGLNYRKDREAWRSYVSPFAPDRVATSGITQPPMLAEAVVKIGKKLSSTERRSWYQHVFPALVHYHQWLYSERNPHAEGLIVNIHPYETGLDNTPPWIVELRRHNMPLWITLIEKLNVEPLLNKIRRDTRHIPPGQRISNIEALAFYSIMRRLRRKAYNTEAIMSRSLFLIEDLSFNCIAIRANHHLKSIAKNIKRNLPEDLLEQMDKAEDALEQLWDGYSGQYYSRNFVSHKLITEPTIATLLPLYAGCISKERAEQLVKLITNAGFNVRYPVPSVPKSSSFFNPTKYWQGPTWLNTNWLIIDGLRRYGYRDAADELAQKSIELVGKHGCYEYFNPYNGQPAGAAGFSWTAALALDLLYAKS